MSRKNIVMAFLLLFSAVQPTANAATKDNAVNTTCKEVADSIVKPQIDQILSGLKSPSYTKLNRKALIDAVGDKLLKEDKPLYKGVGFLTLLWYGDKAQKQKVVDYQKKVKGAEEYAYYFYAIGLYQIGSLDPKTAQKGRSYLAAINRAQPKLIKQENWKKLLKTCQLSR